MPETVNTHSEVQNTRRTVMKKVSVIGMDMGDKNHKAVGLSEDGEIVDRAEGCARRRMCANT